MSSVQVPLLDETARQFEALPSEVQANILRELQRQAERQIFVQRITALRDEIQHHVGPEEAELLVQETLAED